jgi:Tfp pilus assembly major pilin PilA
MRNRPEGFPFLDKEALTKMNEVMRTGESTYGTDTWEEIPLEEHLSHACNHISKWLIGDTTEDHLAHAACRVMGALQQEINRKSTEILPANSKDTDRSDTGQHNMNEQKSLGSLLGRGGIGHGINPL